MTIVDGGHCAASSLFCFGQGFHYRAEIKLLCLMQIIQAKVAALKKTKGGSSISPSLSSPSTLCDVDFRRTERS